MKLRIPVGIFSIRVKLGFIALAVLVVLCALVAVGNTSLEMSNRSQSVQLGLEESTGSLERVLRGLNEIVLTEGSGTSKQAVRRSVKALDESIAQFNVRLKEAGMPEGITRDVAPHLDLLKIQIGELLSFHEGQITIDSEAPISLFTRAMKTGEEISEHLRKVHEEVVGETRERSDTILAWLYVGSAVALVTVFILFGMLYHSIINPIRKVAAFAHSVSAGDFSAQLPMKRRDEIGGIASDLREMAENLRSAMGKVKEASEKVSRNVSEASRKAALSGVKVKETLSSYEAEVDRVISASQQLSAITAQVGAQCDQLKELAGTTARSVEKIVTTVDTVAEGSSSHSHAASEAADRVNGMLQSVMDISMNLQSLAASSTEVAAAITQMQHTVNEVNEKTMESSSAAKSVSEAATTRGLWAVTSAEAGIERIYESVEALALTIRRLDERSKNIGNIVNVIDDIASQTSLLALNAAILAAQAGRHGEGFAIVANEVKALAERISISTREIEKVIKEANSDTIASVKLSRTGIEKAEEGKKLVGEVRLALEDILTQAGRSAELSSHIERAMSEQSIGAGQISAVVNNIAEQVERVSCSANELAAGGHSILDSMETIRLNSAHITEQTLDQRRDSRSILEAAKIIDGSATDISEKMADARHGNRTVADTLENLHLSTQKLADMIEGLGDSLKSLDRETTLMASEADKFSV